MKETRKTKQRGAYTKQKDACINGILVEETFGKILRRKKRGRKIL
jgi:hypothetical protein